MHNPPHPSQNGAGYSHNVTGDGPSPTRNLYEVGTILRIRDEEWTKFTAARKKADSHPANLDTLTPDAKDIFVAKLARCFSLIAAVTNGPDSGASLAVHIGERLRKGEDLSMLMETLEIMTNQNVVQAQHTLNKDLEYHNNVAGIPPRLALATMAPC